MALHLALSIQKCFQGSPRGKNRTLNQSGNCVLIFDNEVTEEKHFTDLLLNAPDWTIVTIIKSQIVDVPHFVDSKAVGLIQLADFICFFLRKHIELTLGYTKPAYKDEVEGALEEGINIEFLSAPGKLIGKNEKLYACEFIRMKMGDLDESGRRRPVPIVGSEFTVELDTLVVSISESPDTSFLKNEKVVN